MKEKAVKQTRGQQDEEQSRAPPSLGLPQSAFFFIDEDRWKLSYNNKHLALSHVMLACKY